MKYFILVLLISVCGCQTIMEEHRKQMTVLCTYDGAYSKGVEHAENQEGSKASSTLSSCESGVMAEALKGYNDGYASLNQPQDNSIGGFIGQILKSKEKHSYFCEIEVFNEKMSAKGRSKAEALHNAKSKCSSRRQDGDFFCKDSSEYSCKKLF